MLLMAKSARPAKPTTQSAAKPASKPQPASKRSGTQYSVGGTVATLLLVLLYWWVNGSAPTPDLPTAPVDATVAVTAVVEATETVPPAATTVAAPITVVAPTTAAARAAPATATAQPLPTVTTPPTLAAVSPSNRSNAPPGMDYVTLEDLPPEALDTLTLIEQDGPFPFSRDGITFQNREGLLPQKARGYYSEYTVITPGESDRGARRIVAGEAGERYYTANHYASFAWIEMP